MPTYQYACTEARCGHTFEQVQSFSDDALTVCPQCEGRLRKVFNAVGVVFKGSGFYRTDSRQAADKSASSATSSDPGSATGASTTDGSSSTSGSTSASSTPSSPSTSSGSSTPSSAGAA